jgi:hypothetical protein
MTAFSAMGCLDGPAADTQVELVRFHGSGLFVCQELISLAGNILCSSEGRNLSIVPVVISINKGDGEYGHIE